jgi:hypothetical protein
MRKYASSDADKDLQEIRAYMRTESPSRLATAERLVAVASKLAYDEPDPGTSVDDIDAPESDEAKGIEILDKAMERVGKGRAKWWMGDAHNFQVNQTLMGTVNTWVFAVLPHGGAKRAYRAKSDRLPEGIVLFPIWQPLDRDSYPLTAKVADLLVKQGKGNLGIKAFVNKQLDEIEVVNGIKIPSGVRSKILSSMEKVAKRRVDIDRLRVKKELWPFDGGKPIALGSFD